MQRTDQDGLELWRKKSRTKFVQCSVDICIIWLCIVFICVSHIIAFCFFCYGSLSIYNSASFIFVFFALLALLFFLSQFVFNAFVYILKLRSTSLILPTLIPFSDSTLSRHLNSCYHYRLIFQQGEGYCVCIMLVNVYIYRKLYHLMFPFHHHCFGHHSILSVSHARSDIPSLTTLMPHYPS